MKKTYLVSADDFERFKRGFLYWVEVFGLRDYRIVFRHELIDDSYADILVNEPGKIATVRLTTGIDASNKDGLDIDGTALHEAIHLVTHRLYWLGACRHIHAEDLDEEWEALTRRLGNAIAAS